MSQVLFTPNGVYKYFRNLVIGHTGGGAESASPPFYVDNQVGTTPVKNLAYFKVGIGGPANAELTETFYRDYCLNNGTEAGKEGYGGLHKPINIFATAIGYASSRDKKALVSSNFTKYGNSVDSKVAGVLAVVASLSGTQYWNRPGVFFQVATALLAGEGNFSPCKSGAFQDAGAEVAVVAPATVEINEIGIFDEDDVMILYGVFPPIPKNNTLSLKVNNVAMQKILDYQLSLTTTTTVI